jgi:hypothetical protein
MYVALHVPMVEKRTRVEIKKIHSLPLETIAKGKCYCHTRSLRLPVFGCHAKKGYQSPRLSFSSSFVQDNKHS